MKKIVAALSYLLVIMLCLHAIPSFAETMFCPYCGKKVDTSYSFCPSCGKSLDGVLEEEETPQQTSNASAYVPGFYHTFSDLYDIAERLFRDTSGAGSKKASTFPVQLSIDLCEMDAITSMNLPYKQRMDYEDTGSYAYMWRYDATRNRFLKENEKFDSPVRVYYRYYPVQPGMDYWMNEIIIQIDDKGEVTLFSVSYVSTAAPTFRENIMISNISRNKIVTYNFYPDGHVEGNVNYY